MKLFPNLESSSKIKSDLPICNFCLPKGANERELAFEMTRYFLDADMSKSDWT